MPTIVEQFIEALLSSDDLQAEALLTEVSRDYSAVELIENIFMPALDSIGSGWENGAYALSQVYMSGRICEQLADKILPEISGKRKTRPKIALALLNDYHSLGKRIVYSVLRAGGYNVIDYGRVETDDLVNKIREDEIEVIMISVLMIPSALQVKQVVRNLSYYPREIKVVVGGAPFRLDHELWREVGADAVGYTASDALNIVQSLAGGLVE